MKDVGTCQLKLLGLNTPHSSSWLPYQDITEIKTNNKPVDIIKLTFDGLQILQSKPVISVKARLPTP